MIAVPVVQVEPLPAVAGEPDVFQQSTVPEVEEMVTVCATLYVPAPGLRVGVAAGVPVPVPDNPAVCGEAPSPPK